MPNWRSPTQMPNCALGFSSVEGGSSSSATAPLGSTTSRPVMPSRQSSRRRSEEVVPSSRPAPTCRHLALGTKNQAKERESLARDALSCAMLCVSDARPLVTAAPCKAPSTKFSLRPTAETLADLSRPIDPRHLKTRKQGTATLTYCPWNTIARHLHHRAPGWCWEVQMFRRLVVPLWSLGD